MSETEDIVRAILEGGDDDADLGKDAFYGDDDPNGSWEQIDGDFGDPWLYGGVWWNPVKRELLHFDGVENEKEIQTEDVEVPPYTMEKIRKMVHDPDLDQEWAREDPAWLEKQLKEEEWEVERKAQEYQYAKAAFLNARKPYTFETFSVDDELSHMFERYIEAIKEQYDEAGARDFDYWPVHIKTVEMLNYLGWGGYADSTHSMNKKEASVMLGTSL